jgi:Tfp pilus assembly protein PilP
MSVNVVAASAESAYQSDRQTATSHRTEKETSPTPAYDAGGRRDPFVSPTEEVEKPQAEGTRGFEVEAIELTGIVSTPKGFTAMVSGPDRKAYFVRVGERFHNGTLVDISPGALTFQVQEPSPFARGVSSNVVVPLHPSVQ